MKVYAFFTEGCVHCICDSWRNAYLAMTQWFNNNYYTFEKMEHTEVFDSFKWVDVETGEAVEAFIEEFTLNDEFYLPHD